jgi:probable HAF family extracellular repeat protein
MEKRNNRMMLGWSLAAAWLATTTAIPLTAQNQATTEKPKGHHHYILIDFGSLGGPGGGIVNPSSRALNNRGMVVGASTTANADPFAPNFCYLGCNVNRGQLFRNEVVAELPPLSSAPNLSSIPVAINFWGQAVGQAQNGAIDPLTGWPEARGVLWQNGQAIAIPTLGGTQSTANDINDFGLVVGASLTATPDPFANSPLCGVLPTAFCGTFATTSTFFPGTTETHAFLWHQGFMRDLGTLGGPDSAAWVTNDLGDVAGWSFTSFVPNASSGVPTVDPFFWSPLTNKMTDIGGFGGTFGAAFWMNNRGQVVGSSNLTGDTGENHAFLWDRGTLKDLGTLGGGSSEAYSVNDLGEVVGTSSRDQGFLTFAFSWKDGVMRDLGTVDGDECSLAYSINSLSQFVGQTVSCSQNLDLHGFIGENDGPIVDLNPLTVPASHLTVVDAVFINDRGEIACLVQEADGSHNGCVLIPCDANHPDIAGCDYGLVEPGIAETASAAPSHVAPTSSTTSAIPSPSTLTPTERTARIRAMTAGRRSRLGLLQSR